LAARGKGVGTPAKLSVQRRHSAHPPVLPFSALHPGWLCRALSSPLGCCPQRCAPQLWHLLLRLLCPSDNLGCFLCLLQPMQVPVRRVPLHEAASIAEEPRSFLLNECDYRPQIAWNDCQALTVVRGTLVCCEKMQSVFRP